MQAMAFLRVDPFCLQAAALSGLLACRPRLFISDNHDAKVTWHGEPLGHRNYKGFPVREKHGVGKLSDSAHSAQAEADSEAEINWVSARREGEGPGFYSIHLLRSEYLGQHHQDSIGGVRINGPQPFHQP